MRFNGSLVLAVAACIALSGCGKKDEQPKGQVVATVDGEEITLTDLRNELNGFNAPDAKVRLQAERQALDAIIVRRILAKAADDADVAKTPEYAQQEKRLKETLLVQTWQAGIVKAVPAPSAEEVEQFVASRPDLYAQRRIFEVDQVRFAPPADPRWAEALRPLKTLEEVTALLSGRKIEFRQDRARIDALSVDPRVVAQIVALPPGEVFVVPNSNVLIANRIRATQIEPVPGDIATRHATAYLKSRRTQETVQRQFGSLLAAAKKDVVYSKTYQPLAPPKAAAALVPKAATPATAAQPAAQ